MRSLLVGFTLAVMCITAPRLAAQKVELSIDASKTGAKIDRNIFGQFAETEETPESYRPATLGHPRR